MGNYRKVIKFKDVKQGQEFIFMDLLFMKVDCDEHYVKGDDKFVAVHMTIGRTKGWLCFFHSNTWVSVEGSERRKRVTDRRK
jgi:hypothetical protein